MNIHIDIKPVMVCLLFMVMGVRDVVAQTDGWNDSRWAVKVGGDINFGRSYSCTSDDAGLTTKKGKDSSLDMDFHINAGYLFPVGGRITVGLFSGVNIGVMSVGFDYANNDYSYSSSADVDGDTYTRHYGQLTMSQTVKCKDIAIPLYADLNIPFDSSVSMYAELGAKVHINVYHKITDSQGSATVSGVYPQYGNMTLDEQWGYDGFGATDLSSAVIDEVKVNPVTASLYSGLGIRFRWSYITLELGAVYQYGFSNMFKYAGSSAITDDNAVVHSTISGTDSQEHVRSLSSLCNKSRLNALGGHISWVYYF